ncbi:lipoprotein-releasing ABC transporter ATP-binding protein LolD [Alteromonas sp. ASW11-19]|uniref:Lipoprotein-releasing system ATP-binding protein LolD n=1 Tax=Alteromonas salexigens TaxID=2982530 RepID=A0ABT2VLL3_9ALTE|nr:lipoprotein-releasing ABC transporter ATP-binding protein LolD [Alteromonas salexigens]MCU7553944.1 lipoprotein-releasing ABC transporter ATP-binding protein LolD [Alteromonas salexigens]
MDAVIRCQGISKSYQEESTTTPVLQDVSFSVNAGEQIAILGSSGSGKSTLLHILGGLDSADTGEVHINGQPILSLSAKALASLRNQDIGFIYQFHHLLPEFTALENVAMPLLINGTSPSEANRRAAEKLDQVGLSHRLTHKPAALSGGERQRVAIARALVNNPSIVLADEPTGNLDHRTGEQVYALLKSLSEQQGTCFVVVTHDRSLAAQMDRTLTIRDGRLAETQVKETAL